VDSPEPERIRPHWPPVNHPSGHTHTSRPQGRLFCGRPLHEVRPCPKWGVLHRVQGLGADGCQPSQPILASPSGTKSRVTGFVGTAAVAHGDVLRFLLPRHTPDTRQPRMALGLAPDPLLLECAVDTCFMSACRKMVVDSVSYHLARNDEIFPKLLSVTAPTGLLAPSFLRLLRVVTREDPSAGRSIRFCMRSGVSTRPCGFDSPRGRRTSAHG